MNKLYSLLQKDVYVDNKALFRYFTPSLEVVRFDDLNYYLNFSLKVKDSDIKVLEYSISNKDKDSSYCNICGKQNCEHIIATLKHYEANHPGEINKTINMIENELLEKRQKEMQDNFNHMFSLIKDDIEINEEAEYSKPVSIKMFIESQDNQIYFKLGRGKYYVIKNIRKFLDSIINKENVKYGKDLEFIHTLSMFDKLSQNVIEILLNYNIHDSLSSQRISLTPILLKELLKVYRNQNIDIDGMNYVVSLNKIKPKLHILDNGRINIIGLEDYKFLLDYNTYIYNQFNRGIDTLGYDESLYKFIYALIKNPYASILPIIEDFKFTIYLKYRDYFTFEDEIGKLLKFNEVTIKSFFDFDDGIIKLQTKIYIDDNLIEEENLDKMSSKIYYKYLKFIDRLGFVNGLLEDEESILNFFRSDLSELKSVSEIYLSESIKNKMVSNFTKPSIRIGYGNDLISVFLEESKYDEDELFEILKAIRKKKKYVILNENQIITLDNEDAKTFSNIVSDLNLDTHYLLDKQRIPLYHAFKAYAYEKDIKMDELLSNLLNDITNFKTADIELPKLNAELRTYQIEAYNWLSILCKYNLGGILADDMGLGKTIEMITLLASLKSNAPSLIVCPKSLIYNWQSEFARFTDNLKVIPIYGSIQQRENIISNISNQEKCVYLTSYDTLRSDIDLYELINFDVCILDEGQFIKNVSAQKTRSVKQINAKHKFVLTGTPIENSVLDLWSIFDFIMPGYLPNIHEFKNKYENDEEYTSIIFKKIAPFILRRTKGEVLTDLPSKYEIIYTCEMNEHQRKLYEAQKLQARNILMTTSRTFDVISLFTRLRQICVDPAMFIENYEHGSGKMETLKELIKDKLNDNHRILIFSQFVKGLEIIQEHLKEQDILYFTITGDTPAKERIDICNEFNLNDKYKIVLVSLKAGGTGLNLTGADTVIHIDPWWNLAVQDQATDRAHRIGQTKTVEVIKLICEHSIEQKVIELQNMKKEVIDKLISNDDSSITNFSKEDLSYILE